VDGTSAASSGTLDSSDPGRLTGTVTGIALIIVAVGALPALVRLLTPAVDAAVSGGSGSSDALTTVSSGAVPLSGRGRQSPLSGPPSDAGPQTGPGLVRTDPSGSSVAGGTRGRHHPPEHRDAPADDGEADDVADGPDLPDGDAPAAVPAGWGRTGDEGEVRVP